MNEMTPLQQQRVLILQRDRTCQLIDRVKGHVCRGELQAAHVPPKQAVKRYWHALWIRYEHEHLSDEQNRCRVTPLGVLYADPELGLAMCMSGHHAFDYLGRRFPRDLLPEFIEQRVSWYGLEPELARLFRNIRPERRAA